MLKHFSQACENNKAPILSVLKLAFASNLQVLEIGSGSGQHAQYFAEHLPHLKWQTSDLAHNHESINAYLSEYKGDNFLPPIALDLEKSFSQIKADAIFTANTLHIVSWDLVEKFFKGVGEVLPLGGKLCIYGPFNYDGKFTSESNADFDVWLKERDSQSGIRDFEQIIKQAHRAQLNLLTDHAMPANNRLLEFIKSAKS